MLPLGVVVHVPQSKERRLIHEWAETSSLRHASFRDAGFASEEEDYAKCGGCGRFQPIGAYWRIACCDMCSDVTWECRRCEHPHFGWDEFAKTKTVQRKNMMIVGDAPRVRIKGDRPTGTWYLEERPLVLARHAVLALCRRVKTRAARPIHQITSDLWRMVLKMF